jgi:hypothetical protein
MHLVKETPILKRQFEQQVALASEHDFFNQVWVQDILHEHWCYLIDHQSAILLRLPFKKKWGLKAFLQPLFIRSLHVFSAVQSNEIVGTLRRKLFLHVNLTLPTSTHLHAGIFQKLTWNDGIDAIRAGYSVNVKRSLKKASTLQLKAITYQDFQTFFVAQKGENLGSLNKDSWLRLAQLFIKAKAMNAAFCVGAFDQEELVSVGLFFKWKSSLYFMKGTLNDAGKKTGALVYLIDAVLEKYVDECRVLDFIGSNQESIASFYRKFGAKDHTYCVLKGRFPLV